MPQREIRLMEAQEPTQTATPEVTPPPKKRGRGRPSGTTGIKWKKPKEIADELGQSGPDMIEQFDVLLPDTVVESFTLTKEQTVKATAKRMESRKKRKPLTKVQKIELLAEIRTLMMQPLAPREIITHICGKWNIARNFAELALEKVQDQTRDYVGFSKIQFQELAQKQLRRVFKLDDMKPLELKGILECADRLFGIAVRPQEEREHEQKISEELMSAVEDMDLDELEELQTRIMAGRLDDVFSGKLENLKDVKLAPKAQSKRRSAVVNRQSQR